LLAHPGRLRTVGEFLPVFIPSLTAKITTDTAEAAQDPT